jgi:hypothetical protein
MPDIPDYTVVRRIKDMVECNCQFDDTQASAKVPSCGGHHIDQLCAEFLRQSG